MLARYYSSSLGRFMAVDPGNDTDAENPQSWNKYAYVRNNPMNALDPDGEATYMVNREFARSEPTGKAVPWDKGISHTFIFTTDEKGNIEHTYSWGNDPDPKNANVEGKWFKDETEDLNAAAEGLKAGFAIQFGDDSLDPYVDKAFDEHANKESDPSNHRNYLIAGNCKTEAGKLVKEAKQDRAKDRDSAHSAKSTSASSGINAYANAANEKRKELQASGKW